MKPYLSVFLLFFTFSGWSQDLIRFTGVVVDKDQLEPVVGATILNKTRGGGAVSDSIGFFSIKARAGDTLLFTDVRYAKSTFVIPEVLEETDYGIIQFLIQNAVQLEEVEIFSFPSQESFKSAFLGIDAKPDMNMRALEKQRELMETVRQAYKNERYYYENWADRRLYELTGQIPPNHLLDPIRWTNFLRDFREQLNEK